jgi:prepilin-type processing-associated H-X9-DG protein
VVNATATSANPYGWADAMQPYLKSTQIFQCPSETGSPSSDPVSGLYSDYWINSRAAGQSDASFDATAVTVLLGDGASQATAATAAATPYPGSGRYYQNGDGVACPGTYSAGASIASFGGAQRHLDGANLAFADGHVKWLKGTTAGTSAAVSRCAGTDRGLPTFIIGSADRVS